MPVVDREKSSVGRYIRITPSEWEKVQKLSEMFGLPLNRIIRYAIRLTYDNETVAI